MPASAGTKQRRYTLRTIFGPPSAGKDKIGIRAVGEGDRGLLPVQDIVVALAPGAQLQVGGV
jgi:hypothetical protein